MFKRIREDLTLWHMSKPSLVKKWGNNLGVRLPATVAKAAHLHPNHMVRVSVEGGCVTITPVDGLELALEQRPALFDLAKHGGEAMAAEPLGAEKW